MDTETAYFNAALPEPITLLGQELLPYSVGHDYLLRRHLSPFLVPRRVTGEEIINHLFMAVFICCQPYRLAKQPIRRDQVLPWRKGICERPPLWRFPDRRHWRPLDACQKVNELIRYIEEGTAKPNFNWVNRGRGVPETPGAPYAAILLDTLLSDIGLSVEEAMDMPLAQANWLYCTYWEARGRISIVSDREEEGLKAIREEAARRGWELMHVVPDESFRTGHQGGKS